MVDAVVLALAADGGVPLVAFDEAVLRLHDEGVERTNGFSIVGSATIEVRGCSGAGCPPPRISVSGHGRRIDRAARSSTLNF